MQITFKQIEVIGVTRILYLLYTTVHYKCLIQRLMDSDEKTVYIEILIISITKAKAHLN